MHIQATGRATALPKFNKLGPMAFGASLLLGAYLLLHTAAQNERISGDATGTIGSGVMHSLLSAAVSMAPMALLIVGLQTMLNVNHEGERIMRRTRGSVVSALTVTDIDQLVGDRYRKQGYTVIENRGHLSDGGVDLVLRDGQTTIYGITRHLRDRYIEIDAVKSLFSAMKSGAATGGLVVSSGRFSPEAKSFAALSGIRLIDSKTLDQLVRGA
jgi:restriction system protein